MTPSASEIRSFCNACQRSTRHDALGSYGRVSREGDQEFPRVIEEAWNILQCLGCESIKVCVVQTSTDFKSPREAHFPTVVFRNVPKWAAQLPQEFHELIREVYFALNASCPCLSTMGTRTLIDKMLNDLVGDVGGFAQKLNEAVKSGYVTEKQRQTIESAVEIGHAASHRGYYPTIEEVFDVLDIVEHALVGGYVIGKASSRLNASIPRKARGTS
jgi:hypothetical protein